MAYSVSTNYRKVIYSGGAENTALLSINNIDVQPSQIAKITISSPIIDTSSDVMYVGTFISQQIEIQFKNLDGIELNGEVYLQIGTKVDGAYEYVPIGYFIIDTPKETYQQTSKIVCLDRAVKFKPNIDISQFFTDGKTTLENLFKSLCTYYGVEYGTYPTLNKDVEVSVYDNTLSGKKYISYIAELMGSNAKFGRDGKLYLLPLKGTPTVTIDALQSKSWELSELYNITRVVYQDAIRKFEYGTMASNTLYVRQENMFVTDVQIISNLFDDINGTQIYSLKTENYGDPSLDCWDNISYTLGDDTYNTLNNNTLTYEMNMSSVVETIIPTKATEETTNIVGGNDETRVRRIETTVNQLDGSIKLLTTGVLNVNDDLNDNYYTKTQSNTLIQTATDGLTNVFKETGGNNLLLNTAPYSMLTDTTADYWTNNIGRMKEISSVSGWAIVLKNGSTSQTIELSSSNYAIRFEYKRLLPEKTASVKFNGKTIQLTGDSGVIESIESITSGSLTIEFISNYDDAFEIINLKVNSGTNYTVWTQNPNESTSGTVNISSGITVSSSSSNTLATMKDDGFKVKNKTTGEEVMVATDDGGKFKNIEAETSKVGGEIKQKVGNQTWVVGGA